MIGNSPSEKSGRKAGVRPPLEKVWEFEAGGDVISWATAYGMVFFGSKDKRIYAVDAASGQQKWTFEMDTTVHPHPFYFVVADGILFILGEDENLYAIDAQTGKKRWQFSGKGMRGSPITANEITYVTCLRKISWRKKENILYAIDAQTGLERWRYSTDKDIGSPAVGYGKIFFWTKDKRVYALDADSGEKRWEFESGHKIYSRPTVTDGKVLIYGDMDLYAFDANSGALLWKVDAREHNPEGPPVVGNLVLLGFELTFVDLASGVEKTKLTPGSSGWIIDRVKNAIIYTRFAGAPGTLFAIDLATGELKWYAVIATGWQPYFDFTCSEEFVFAQAKVGVAKTCAINISRFTKRWDFPEPGSLPKIVDEMLTWGSARKMYGYTSSKDPASQHLLEIGEDVAQTPMYTGTVLPIAYIQKFLGGEGKIVWPNCCCLCCGPVEKRVNLVKTMDRVRLWAEGIPYCATCYKRTKGLFKKEKPGVEIIRTSPPTFAFRNEKYWAMFMKANRAR